MIYTVLLLIVIFGILFLIEPRSTWDSRDRIICPTCHVGKIDVRYFGECYKFGDIETPCSECGFGNSGENLDCL